MNKQKQEVTNKLIHLKNNMILPKEAIITQEIKIEQEEKKFGNIILAMEVVEDKFHKVLYTGEDVKYLQDKVIRVKENMGEKLDIDFKEYMYFPYGESSYYYIKD